MEDNTPKNEYELYKGLQTRLDLEYNKLKVTGAGTGLDNLFISRVRKLVEQGYSPPSEFEGIVKNIEMLETSDSKED
jgi:hypothetical protein